MSARSAVLAHEGGWDEFLLIAGPIVAIGGLLLLAKRRLERTEGADDPADPPDSADLADSADPAGSTTADAGDATTADGTARAIDQTP